MKIKRTVFLVLSFFVFLNSFAMSFAESMPVPVKIQIALLIKILSYDKAIKSDIKIGVLSGGSKGDVVKAFQSLSGEKISGHSFSVTEVDINSIKSSGIDVLYVTPDNKGKIAQISKVAKSSGILTMTGVPDYVNDGLSVGIELKDGKPKIIVNMDSSKKESRNFSSQLLKLCRII